MMKNQLVLILAGTLAATLSYNAHATTFVQAESCKATSVEIGYSNIPNYLNVFVDVATANLTSGKPQSALVNYNSTLEDGPTINLVDNIQVSGDGTSLTATLEEGASSLVIAKFSSKGATAIFKRHGMQAATYSCDFLLP